MPRRISFIIIITAALALVCAPALAQGPDAEASAGDKFESGKRLLEQGDAQGAIPLLRDAAEQRKKDADAWYFYGVALSRARRAKDARKVFEKALKLRPDDTGAHTGLAFTLLLLGKPNDAEREARVALKLDPKHAEAHYIIGVVRLREENIAGAGEEAEAALRFKPDFPAAAVLAANVLLDIYADETALHGERYPPTPASDEDERKAELEKRSSALDSIKARMREIADRLEAFIKAQPNSPEAAEWREQAASLRFYTRAGSKSEGVFSPNNVMVKAIITFKPEPSFTEEARRHDTKGVVRLRAVLAADGHVRHVLAIRRLPDGLTENAIEAAHQIRFMPATINGQPVSQFVTLEYNFNIY